MKKIPQLSTVAGSLQSELHRRFAKYTSPSAEGHNPVMLAATSLDVRYKLLLNAVQLTSAKRFLLQQVTEIDFNSY